MGTFVFNLQCRHDALHDFMLEPIECFVRHWTGSLSQVKNVIPSLGFLAGLGRCTGLGLKSDFSNQPKNLIPAANKPINVAPSANQSTCEVVHVRKEWRTLTRQEQAAYIASVKCLARLPSKLLGHSYRRWDDFEYVHCEMRHRVHERPIFLPWHRYFIFIYEKVLRDECKYKGSLPYWNWTLDSKNITRSPIWSSDPVTGFGSNGTFFGEGHDPSDLDAGVVTDGAFAKFPIYYPGRMLLQRNFSLQAPFAIPDYYLGSQWYDPNNMAIIASQANYSSFLTKLEGNHLMPGGRSRLPGPHLLIHILLGGDMLRLSYSANDPIFFVHHARVDEVWWAWQMADWPRRAYEFLPSDGFTASLDDQLEYLGLVPNTTVRVVMDTLIPPLCYRYDT